MLKIILGLFLLSTSVALAQQSPPSPSEVALQLNAMIGSWAQTIMQQGRTIEELQKQLATSEARVKELEARQEKK